MKKIKFSILGLMGLLIAVPLYLFGASYAMERLAPTTEHTTYQSADTHVTNTRDNQHNFNDKLIAAGIHPASSNDDTVTMVESEQNTLK